MAAAPKSEFPRRDRLVQIQQQMQAEWEKDKIFEQDAPANSTDNSNSYLVTFPYPYMNGRLHLGHAFTVSKAEFAVSVARLQGKHALWPFGYHVTGMPIRACADKLKYEIATYGNPPVFPKDEAPPAEEAAPEAVGTASNSPSGGEGGEGGAPSGASPGASSSAGAAEVTGEKKFKKGPNKQQQKAGGKKWQWDIMIMNGLTPEEIPRFQDTNAWLDYFPGYGAADLKAFGAKIDHRRSFLTTDANPYYDSFIRWQFTILHTQDKIKYGRRPCIYSATDGQPCMDHDRASGEGVQPQEYSLVKMRILELPPKMAAVIPGWTVFLAAATLRTETMYGQTNCWAHPDIVYGVYAVGEKEALVMTARSARNLSYQIFKESDAAFGKIQLLLEVCGADLFGVPLAAPLTSYPVIYTLPMLTIKDSKGTGIVTSVPSDAPDDWQALVDLKNKPKLREKYGIKDEWVLPFEAIPIIDIPGLGNMSAKTMCEQLKIQSQNDFELLKQAKEETYKRGFYEGVMIVGDVAGLPVQQAKPLVRERLIASGDVMKYWEPENEVMSRSGDVCVVCLADQWYIDYGETEWRKTVDNVLARMELYHPETRDKFVATLEWLKEWACSRSYGLGTRIPWDPRYLIESLSDSTIYMAYYSVAHLLQGNVLGTATGPAGVSAAQCTHQFWDYIFLGGSFDSSWGVSEGTMQSLRNEFEYWYPMDLRVSGYDLIPNHLTFTLYNHNAVFGESKAPLAFRANGFLNLNGEKMSKSTGNFLSMRDAIDKYGADAMRFTLADAGDGLEDGNFMEETANKAILRLWTFLTWVEEVTSTAASLRSGSLDGFWDDMFMAVMDEFANKAVKSYANLEFREALISGLFSLQAARDLYRDAVAVMHHDVIMRYIELQAVLLAPITPHLSDYIHRHIGKGSVMNARFPEEKVVNTVWLDTYNYLANSLHDFHVARANKTKKLKNIRAAFVGFAAARPAWQIRAIEFIGRHYSDSEPHFTIDKKALVQAANADLAIDSKKDKLTVPFIMDIKEKLEKGAGRKALALTVTFDEGAVLHAAEAFLKKSLDVEALEIVPMVEGSTHPNATALKAAIPGEPTVLFTE